MTATLWLLIPHAFHSVLRLIKTIAIPCGLFVLAADIWRSDSVGFDQFTVALEPNRYDSAFLIATPVSMETTAEDIRWCFRYGVDATAAVDDEQPVTLVDNSLHCQIQPNPCNGATTITCSLSNRMSTRLEIRNVLGQLVRVLVDETQIAGDHHVMWDNTNTDGAVAASGVYYCHLQCERIGITSRILLMK